MLLRICVPCPLLPAAWAALTSRSPPCRAARPPRAAACPRPQPRPSPCLLPGTPFWRLVLKQFDDLLVKILIVAAVVDLLIALASGEGGWGAFVEPGVIVLILLANGG